MNEVPSYFSGTSGLLLPVPNKQFYPPAFRDRSRLCYYASLMNSIEVNSTFYKIPLRSTVAKWFSEVPESFKFTFKLPKEITHNKDLAFDPALLSRFFEVINIVHSKNGCVLVQLPPSVRIAQFKQLELLMQCLLICDPLKEWNIALEFRHNTLYIDEVCELLATYQMGMVIHDKDHSNSPIVKVDESFVYLRFHGPNGNYRDSYSDEVLSEYATYIRDWLAEDKKVFVYFNNTMGDAYLNSHTLKNFVLNSAN